MESKSCHNTCISRIGACWWSISKNKVYLWGTKFYWLCNIKSINKILEYLGPIHALRQRCQEQLSYDFMLAHRPERMMRDIDTLNRDPIIR